MYSRASGSCSYSNAHGSDGSGDGSGGDAQATCKGGRLVGLGDVAGMMSMAVRGLLVTRCRMQQQLAPRLLLGLRAFSGSLIGFQACYDGNQGLSTRHRF